MKLRTDITEQACVELDEQEFNEILAEGQGTEKTSLQPGQQRLNLFFKKDALKSHAEPKLIEKSDKKLQKDGSIKKTPYKCKEVGKGKEKFYLHHKSLLNDPTLQPRKLEASENIFEIIMPWVPDERKEEE